MARILYAPVFKISDPALDLGTLTIVDDTNPQIVVTLANLREDGVGAAYQNSPWFFHSNGVNFTIQKQDGSGTEVLPHLARNSLMIALANEIGDQATANGWANPSNLSVNFFPDEGVYEIGYIAGSGVNISLTWSTTNGRALFGYANNPGGAQRHKSTRVCDYLIKPNLTAVSNPTPDREVEGVASLAINDEGTAAFGVSKKGTANERDWVQQFEPVAKCKPINATVDHPFTHHHLFRHCRKGVPFAVLNGGFGNELAEVFYLRPEGTQFSAEYAVPNRSDRRNVQYRTYAWGAIG